MKQYAVIGLGTFGFNLAIELTQCGNQVLAIDMDKSVINQIKDKVTNAVATNAMDLDSLSEHISIDFDVAILGLGEKNMEATVLAIVHLKKMGVKEIIVKATNAIRGEVYLSVGATDIIYPEKETATRLAKRLLMPALIEQITLSPEYEIIEFALPDNLIGKTLRQINLREKYGVAVIAIKDVLNDKMELVPQPDQVLGADNALIIIGKNYDIIKMNQLS